MPRWEWRTFGARLGAAEGLLDLREPERVQESDELYVLSQETDASVKVRDGVLDVKRLEAVDGNGLDLVPLLRQRSPTMPIIVFTAQEADPIETGSVDLVLVKSRATLDRLVDAVMERIERQGAQAK